MVRINLIYPGCLADEHLRAEYAEILMLVGYVRKHPDAFGIPCSYCLGKGHVRFFKDKLLYLKKRYEEIKHEMRSRGFRARRSVNLRGFPPEMLKDWEPSREDKETVKKRIVEKLRLKPHYYHYYGEKRSLDFLVGLVEGC